MDIKSKLIFQAILANNAERISDMNSFLKNALKVVSNVMQTDPDLEEEDCDLLQILIKKLIIPKRIGWRKIVGMNLQYLIKNSDYTEVVTGFKNQMRKEITDECLEIIRVLNKCIDSKQSIPTTLPLLWKLRGDLYRYMYEVEDHEMSKEPKKYAEEALKSYIEAVNASKDPKDMYSIWLGLILNFSVFYYEILHCPEKACELAKKALSDTADYPRTKEITTIIQLLRDHMSIWSAQIKS